MPERPTEEQQQRLDALRQRWQEDTQQVVERGLVSVETAARHPWVAHSREPIADLIARLEWKSYGGGRAGLVAIAAEIAATARYDRDRLRAVELLLAYTDGRPAQTVLHADVTPQWLEQQIRARHPALTNEEVEALMARLVSTKVLPDQD